MVVFVPYQPEAVAQLVDSLPEEEQQAVREFRLALQEEGIEAPDDLCLLRFLRARKFKLRKALRLYLEAKQVVEDNNYDLLFEHHRPSPLELKYWAHGFYGIDRGGYPIYWQAVGRVDPVGLFRVGTMHQIVNHEIFSARLGLSISEQLTRRRKELISQTTMVFDLQGVSMRHVTRNFVNLFTDNVSKFEQVFPECLHKAIVINAPRIFPMLFGMLKPFLAEDTIKKISVCGTDPVQVRAALVDAIDEHWIPKEYGGQADVSEFVSFAGAVPEEEFLSASFEGDHSAEVSKTTTYTHSVGACERGQVVCWTLLSTHSLEARVSVDGIVQFQRRYDCFDAPQFDYYPLVEAGGNVELQLVGTSGKTRSVDFTVSLEDGPSRLGERMLKLWLEQHAEHIGPDPDEVTETTSSDPPVEAPDAIMETASPALLVAGPNLVQALLNEPDSGLLSSALV